MPEDKVLDITPEESAARKQRLADRGIGSTEPLSEEEQLSFEEMAQTEVEDIKQKKVSVSEFAKSVRDKYPKAYDKYSDDELTKMVIKKYPGYKNGINFETVKKKDFSPVSQDQIDPAKPSELESQSISDGTDTSSETSESNKETSELSFDNELFANLTDDVSKLDIYEREYDAATKRFRPSKPPETPEYKTDIDNKRIELAEMTRLKMRIDRAKFLETDATVDEKNLFLSLEKDRIENEDFGKSNQFEDVYNLFIDATEKLSFGLIDYQTDADKKESRRLVAVNAQNELIEKINKRVTLGLDDEYMNLDNEIKRLDENKEISPEDYIVKRKGLVDSAQKLEVGFEQIDDVISGMYFLNNDLYGTMGHQESALKTYSNIITSLPRQSASLIKGLHEINKATAWIGNPLGLLDKTYQKQTDAAVESLYNYLSDISEGMRYDVDPEKELSNEMGGLAGIVSLMGLLGPTGSAVGLGETALGVTYMAAMTHDEFYSDLRNQNKENDLGLTDQEMIWAANTYAPFATGLFYIAGIKNMVKRPSVAKEFTSWFIKNKGAFKNLSKEGQYQFTKRWFQSKATNFVKHGHQLGTAMAGGQFTGMIIKGAMNSVQDEDRQIQWAEGNNVLNAVKDIGTAYKAGFAIGGFMSIAQGTIAPETFHSAAIKLTNPYYVNKIKAEFLRLKNKKGKDGLSELQYKDNLEILNRDIETVQLIKPNLTPENRFESAKLINELLTLEKEVKGKKGMGKQNDRMKEIEAELDNIGEAEYAKQNEMTSSKPLGKEVKKPVKEVAKKEEKVSPIREIDKEIQKTLDADKVDEIKLRKLEDKKAEIKKEADKIFEQENADIVDDINNVRNVVSSIEGEKAGLEKRIDQVINSDKINEIELRKLEDELQSIEGGKEFNDARSTLIQALRDKQDLYNEIYDRVASGEKFEDRPSDVKRPEPKVEKKEDQPEIPEGTLQGSEDHVNWVIENSKDPNEIADTYESQKSPAGKLEEWQQAVLGYTTTTKSFDRFIDPNYRKDNSVRAVAWIRKSGTTIDNIAKEVSYDFFGEPTAISAQQVADLIVEFPNRYAKKTTDKGRELARKYRDITGKSIKRHTYIEPKNMGMIDSKTLDKIYEEKFYDQKQFDEAIERAYVDRKSEQNKRSLKEDTERRRKAAEGKEVTTGKQTEIFKETKPEEKPKPETKSKKELKAEKEAEERIEVEINIKKSKKEVQEKVDKIKMPVLPKAPTILKNLFILNRKQTNNMIETSVEILNKSKAKEFLNMETKNLSNENAARYLEVLEGYLKTGDLIGSSDFAIERGNQLAEKDAKPFKLKKRWFGEREAVNLVMGNIQHVVQSTFKGLTTKEKNTLKTNSKLTEIETNSSLHALNVNKTVDTRQKLSNKTRELTGGFAKNRIKVERRKIKLINDAQLMGALLSPPAKVKTNSEWLAHVKNKINNSKRNLETMAELHSNAPELMRQYKYAIEKQNEFLEFLETLELTPEQLDQKFTKDHPIIEKLREYNNQSLKVLLSYVDFHKMQGPTVEIYQKAKNGEEFINELYTHSREHSIPSELQIAKGKGDAEQNVYDKIMREYNLETSPLEKIGVKAGSLMDRMSGSNKDSFYNPLRWESDQFNAFDMASKEAYLAEPILHFDSYTKNLAWQKAIGHPQRVNDFKSEVQKAVNYFNAKDNFAIQFNTNTRGGRNARKGWGSFMNNMYRVLLGPAQNIKQRTVVAYPLITTLDSFSFGKVLNTLSRSSLERDALAYTFINYSSGGARNAMNLIDSGIGTNAIFMKKQFDWYSDFSISTPDYQSNMISWSTAYRHYRMKQQGVKKFNWGKESANPSKKAITHANAETALSQGHSLREFQADFVKSNNMMFQSLRMFLMPYGTFISQQKMSVGTDITQLFSDPSAAKRLVGYTGIISAYHTAAYTIGKTVGTVAFDQIIKLLGSDEEDMELRKMLGYIRDRSMMSYAERMKMGMIRDLVLFPIPASPQLENIVLDYVVNGMYYQIMNNLKYGGVFNNYEQFKEVGAWNIPIYKTDFYYVFPEIEMAANVIHYNKILDDGYYTFINKKGEESYVSLSEKERKWVEVVKDMQYLGMLLVAQVPRNAIKQIASSYKKSKTTQWLADQAIKEGWDDESYDLLVHTLKRNAYAGNMPELNKAFSTGMIAEHAGKEKELTVKLQKMLELKIMSKIKSLNGGSEISMNDAIKITKMVEQWDRAYRFNNPDLSKD